MDQSRYYEHYGLVTNILISKKNCYTAEDIIHRIIHKTYLSVNQID